MNRVSRVVAAVILMVLSAKASAQNLSNTGTDFWVGYGHHQFMEQGQSNGQEMVLYFAAQQATTVTVNIWGTTWTRTYNMAAGQVLASDLIPKAGTFDARLITVGCGFVPDPATWACGGEGSFSKKGIHITSTAPIVAYAHIYGSASSGATMLVPVETWGYAYTSVNSEQNYDVNCFSWMYVIAKEDNTVVEITPSVVTRRGRPANTPFTVTLNKGDIYQTMAGPEGGTAKSQMTGTRVKSIANANGQCYPIAVFSGSSRTSNPASCGSGGGDNDNQQLFPSVAWGRRYLTAPTSNSTGAATFMRNSYKVVVRDPTTVVRRNGVVLTGLLLNSYYRFESTTADLIEADKPIMVAQFMTGGSCLNGGNGDPEMIIISPIEQGTKRIAFYRNIQQGITTNYLTLVVPNRGTGLSSLRIDGNNVFDHTYVHPLNSNYTVVVKRWPASPAQSTAFCDSGFTAITYGLGLVESYGFNAGTLMNNLAARSVVYNQGDPALADTVQQFTCKGTPVKIRALLGYKPTNMLWRLSQVAAISPNTDVNIANPTILDSFQVGLSYYYRYELPGTYTFNDTGTIYIPIVNTEPTIESCTRSEEVKIAVVVKPAPFANLTVNHSGCSLDTAYFSSSANGGYGSTVTKWQWNLGDGTTASSKDTARLYATPGTYNVSLKVFSREGCVNDTVRSVVIGSKPQATITATPTAACVNTPVVFSDLTTLAVSGTWYWDFGNSTTATVNSNTSQTVTYTTPGSYTVKHIVKTSPTCVSDTVTTVMVVNPLPAKPVVANPYNYCQNLVAVPLSATALPSHTLNWYAAYPLVGNGTSTAPIPSTATQGSTQYFVTQTSTAGCTSDTAIVVVNVTPAIATNTISADQTVCSGSPAAALTGTPASGGSGSNYNYQWQQSTDGGTTWQNIAGATTVSPFNPGVLSAGVTKFRREVKSGLCTSYSNVIDITVQTNLNNYNVNVTPAIICQGSPSPLIDGETPTGGNPPYTYQWQGSTDGVNWTVINGATLEDYQPGTLTVKTFFRRIATGGNCPAISNPVSITLSPTANGSISAPAAICQYDSARITFTSTAGNAPFTIQYTITAPGGGLTTVNQTVAVAGSVNYLVIPVNSAPGAYTIALQSVSDNGGCVRTTGFTPVTINVTAKPDVIFSPAVPVVCAGTPRSIIASGATDFVWNPATGLSSSTTGTVTATLTATTTYQVIGTTSGCKDTADITVTVNPIPAKPLPVVRSVIYCQTTASVPLAATALAGHTLTWYSSYPLTGGTATAPTPSTATAGTYSFYVTQTATTSGCVSDTSIITVTVTPAITNNTIGSDRTICSGTAAPAFTASTPTGGINNFTYQWEISTNGGTTWTVIAGATNQVYDPGVQPTGIIRFRRVVKSGVCTSVSNVVVLTVETNLNNYEISGAATICSGSVPNNIDGQTPTGGTGNYSYQWQSSADGTTWANIAGATAEDYQPAALTATTWYRRITSGGNCPATSQSVRILVNPLPNAAITGPSGICSYDSAAVSFTASAGTAPFVVQMTLTAPGGGTTTITRTVTGNGPSSITVLPQNSTGGTYTVQLTSITDATGCSRTSGLGSVNIVVTTKPNVTITAANGTVCASTPTLLTATGATTYQWTASSTLNALTGSVVTATPTDTTDFEVVGTTNGCRDTAEITVNAVPLPAKPVVTANVEYCVNATAQALSATATGNNTITWYTTAALTNGTSTAPTPSTTTAGSVTYYVTQTNSNGCVSEASTITVKVNPLPIVRFTLPAGICMPNGTGVFSNNTTISGGGALNYAWSFGDGIGTSTATNPTYGYATSGSYTVSLTATSAFGCADSAKQTMSAFFEKPVADFDVNPLELCQGQSNTFTDNSNPSGSTITKWQWLFGDGRTDAVKNPVHRYSQPGDYTIKLVVTTAIGCVSDTFTQGVKVYLQPRVDAGPSFTVPAGTLVQFKATANDTNNVSLLWTPPLGLSNPGILQPTVVVGNTQGVAGATYQTYTLTATGDGGCTASDTLTVRVLQQVEVPNAFSPNGDGINDRWIINNLADYPGAKVEVYNRWGQQVYLSYGYNKAWDGSYLGKPLPLATYYYVITLNNGFAPVKGAVTIVK